jgi:hypothetical protein
MDRTPRSIGRVVAWFACTLGGFGSFLQWLGLKPKDLGLSQSISIPHVLWLLLAITLFAIGIISAIWSGIVQRREINHLRDAAAQINAERKGSEEAHSEEIRKQNAQQEAELWRAEESRRQCEEERRKALQQLEENRAHLSMFSPLQIECIELARDLNGLLEEMPPPDDPVTQVMRGEGNVRNALEWSARVAAHPKEMEAWSDRLGHAYAAKYSARMTGLVHKLGAKGIDVSELRTFAGWVGSDNNVNRAIYLLRVAVFEIEDNDETRIPRRTEGARSIR